MAKNLFVTIIQTKLFWEDIEKNLSHFSSLINTIKKDSSDLIVLPEMFSTGFSMNAKDFAEDENGKSMQWMRETAAYKKMVVCGSIMTRDGENYYNRFIWMRPDGSYEKYDKRHLFAYGKEEQTYSAGNEKIIVELNGWKILPLICYDLRFPVWSRQNASSQLAIGNWQLPTANYDLILYVANWPERRRNAWKQLLIARAIENVSYVVGLNRIGKDGNDINHTGDSVAIDFLGNKISKTKASAQSVETIKLNKDNLDQFRNDFPVLKGADDFEIKL